MCVHVGRGGYRWEKFDIQSLAGPQEEYRWPSKMTEIKGMNGKKSG